MEITGEHLVKIIVTVILLISVPIIKHISKKILQRNLLLRDKSEERLGQVRRIFSITINLSAIILLITIWGVDPRNILVALSSIFAVIGVALFAQWSLLSNVTAGIIIFFTSPFRAGDFIRIVDKEIPMDAKVEDIFAFHTHLRTKDGEKITYPNSLFFQKGVMVLHIESWDNESDE